MSMNAVSGVSLVKTAGLVVDALTAVRDDPVDLTDNLRCQIEDVLRRSASSMGTADSDWLVDAVAVLDGLWHAPIVFGYVPSRMLFDAWVATHEGAAVTAA